LIRLFVCWLTSSDIYSGHVQQNLSKNIQKMVRNGTSWVTNFDCHCKSMDRLGWGCNGSSSFFGGGGDPQKRSLLFIDPDTLQIRNPIWFEVRTGQI
jgi:hypothetical protein